MLNRKAFPMSKVQVSDAVHRHARRGQSRHQRAKGRSCDGKIICTSTWVQVVRTLDQQVPGNNRAVKPSKYRIALAGQPCLTPLAMRNCPPFFSCEFNVCHTTVRDHAQESLNEPRQCCFFKTVEDPGVIDTRIRTGQIDQQNTGIT